MKIKKIIIIPICFLMLFWADDVSGQYSTYHLTFPEHTSSEVRMAVFHAPYSALLNYRDSATHRQAFLLVKKQLSNTYAHSYKYLSTPFMSGGVDYTVEDMKIVGNTCYICGKVYIYGGSIEPPDIPVDPYFPVGMRTITNYYEHGYFALLNLDGIDGPYALSSFIHYRFKILFNTKELTKLVVHTCEPGHDTIIGLIGKTEGSTPKPCLVTAKINDISVVPTIHEFDSPNETFSDIALVGKALVTTSRFSSENYTFGLRIAPHDDIFRFGDISQFESLHKVNALECSPNTWHRHDANIYIAEDPTTDMATIAYESRCISDSDTNNYFPHISLFQVKCVAAYPSYFTFYKSYTSSTLPSPQESLKGIKHLSSIYINKVAFLLSIPSHNLYKGLIRLFGWSTATQPAFYTPQEYLTDIDVSSGNCIWTVGTNPSDKAIHQYYHDLSVDELCYDPSPGNYRLLCEKISTDTSKTDKTDIIEILLWTTEGHMECTSVKPIVKCIH
jgi:hypothetical protein